MKQMEELIHISKTLEFDKLKVTAVLTFVFSLCDLFYFEESYMPPVLFRPSPSSPRLDIWRKRESSRKCPKERLSST